MTGSPVVTSFGDGTGSGDDGTGSGAVLGSGDVAKAADPGMVGDLRQDAIRRGAVGAGRGAFRRDLLGSTCFGMPGVVAQAGGWAVAAAIAVAVQAGVDWRAAAAAVEQRQRASDSVRLARIVPRRVGYFLDDGGLGRMVRGPMGAELDDARSKVM
jgi:hypothetical protein